MKVVVTLEIEVECEVLDFDPGTPDQTSGPPETWYQGDCAEVTLGTIVFYGIDNTLNDILQDVYYEDIEQKVIDKLLSIM